MSRIFITGDTHGDFTRFSAKNFPIQKELCKDDIMIILGDFGGIWDYRGESKNERYWLDWLEDKNFSIAFIDGNHECFPRLYSYPIKEWNGGKTHELLPHIHHLMRGEIFNINDKTFLAMGGNSSHDIQDGILDPNETDFKEKYYRYCREYKQFRILGQSWWPQEMPSQLEFENAQKNLDKNKLIVDYVLAHSAPASAVKTLGLDDTNDLEKNWEGAIARGLRVSETFFSGHYHIDKVFEHIRFMYTDIVELGV